MWANMLQMMYFPAELLSAAATFALPLKKKGHMAVHMLVTLGINMLIALACGGLMSAYSGLNEREAAEITEPFLLIGVASYGFWCALIFGVVVFGIKLCCDIGWREAVYCGTCAYLAEHAAYCIRILVNGATCSAAADAGTVMWALIHGGVYLFCNYMITRHMVHNRHYEASLMQSLRLLAVSLAVVIVLSLVADIRGFEPLHAAYGLLICLVLLYGQVGQAKQTALQRELSMKDQLWMKHSTQYETARETIDIINKKCHDLKHQVAALRKINNPVRQEEVIESIEKSIMIYDAMMDTGNDILDTVLTEKSLICSQNHITMTCMTDGKLLEFMDTVDLYTIFGNALDNAIEAVMKIGDEDARYISLFIYEKVNLIFIRFENIYEGTLNMEKGIPDSGKPKNGYHGFGIRSITDTVQKYGGVVSIETENQVFTLRITIPAQAE